MQRLVHLGMIKDLEIHNNSINIVRKRLNEVCIGVITEMILEYVFAIPDKINKRFVDNFTSNNWPTIQINKYSIRSEYVAHSEYSQLKLTVKNKAHTYVVYSFTKYVWDYIVHGHNHNKIYYDYGHAFDQYLNKYWDTCMPMLLMSR